jgi:flagellar biosynthesis protein FlhB
LEVFNLALLKLNLQYFSQEKTEKATPKKRQESRRKGQVAKSSDINTAISLLVVFLFLWIGGKFFFQLITANFRSGLGTTILMDITEGSIHELFIQLSIDAVKVVGPIMLIALIAGIFSNFIQVGALFSTEAIQMKLERINPLQGFKRIYSLRAIVELIKSMLKIIVIGAVAFAVLWIDKEKILSIARLDIVDSLTLVGTLIIKLGLFVSIALVFLAVLDFMYQKYDFEKNIRMSKQDIKDEYKKSEGDPLIKSKIKEKQRQMAMRRMMQEIPKADVIITNPTHFAIALKYDEEKMDAPVIIAKGIDYLALKIKEIGKENKIVMVENRPLARALYASAEIGDVVPEQFFKAIAEVLAYVYRLKGKAK